MILVDDNTDSIKHNYPFAVKIEAYEGNQEDVHLKNTFQTLLRFYNWTNSFKFDQPVDDFFNLDCKKIQNTINT